MTWQDGFGNKHDLDYVLERGGTDEILGVPIAFIESAWRRYTKHSKNKVQEIEAAVMPIALTFSRHQPFCGAVLAGEFTASALHQLESKGFGVLHIPYDSILAAFKELGIDASSEDGVGGTTEKQFREKIAKWESLPQPQSTSRLVAKLRALHKGEVDVFKQRLEAALGRQVASIRLTVLRGHSVSTRTLTVRLPIWLKRRSHIGCVKMESRESRLKFRFDSILARRLKQFFQNAMRRSPFSVVSPEKIIKARNELSSRRKGDTGRVKSASAAEENEIGLAGDCQEFANGPFGQSRRRRPHESMRRTPFFSPHPFAAFGLAVALLGVVPGAWRAQGANVGLDSPTTPEGYVALLLINEVPFPGERAYISEEDSKAAMLSVLWVLHCRLTAIPPGYTQKQVADVRASNVMDIMTAGGIRGQVDGFYQGTDGQPMAVARVHERVAHLVGLANRGQPGKIAGLLNYARDLARQYFQTGPAAPDIFADLRKIGSKQVTGHGYAWMTDARQFDPGGSYVFIPDRNQGALGGNRFYTLEKRK